MKKLLGIVFLCLLWCNVVQAASAFATCRNGYCEFTLNIMYDWAETNCRQTLIREYVNISLTYFIIDSTDETCRIYDGQ